MNDGMDDPLVSVIHERYQRVLGQIADAIVRSRRGAGSVRLVVVTKSMPLEVVQAAISAGAAFLGESYAQEAVVKINALPESGVEWHMIGHVQSRKAELVASHFSMLHSLDSVKLADRLDRYCNAMNRTLPVLLEMNVSGEESKFGFAAWDESSWQDLEDSIEQIISLRHLSMRGLMTMQPIFDNPEKTRPYFQRLHRLQEFLRIRFRQTDWEELSMGTSSDFIAAVEEGATYVRVGQAILGPRPI